MTSRYGRKLIAMALPKLGVGKIRDKIKWRKRTRACERTLYKRSTSSLEIEKAHAQTNKFVRFHYNTLCWTQSLPHRICLLYFDYFFDLGSVSLHWSPSWWLLILISATSAARYIHNYLCCSLNLVDSECTFSAAYKDVSIHFGHVHLAEWMVPLSTSDNIFGKRAPENDSDKRC